MTRVIVVDDHPVVREALARLIDAEDDLSVIAQAGSGDAALEAAIANAPDVILMDMSMTPIDGIETTRRILSALSDVRVLVLAAWVEPHEVLEAVDAGAVGVLLKDSDPRNIVEGIRSVARGESPFDPRVASALVHDRQSHASGLHLSRRETEVLTLAAHGLLNKQIARALSIREKTVKTHLTHAYQRIGVTSRIEAIAWMERAGVLDRGDDEQHDDEQHDD